MVDPVSDETYSCISCDYMSDVRAESCPQCGGNVLSARTLRRRGWWLIVLGLILTISFTVFIISQAIRIYHSGDPDAKVRYTASSATITFIFAVCGLVLLFSILATISGIWQVRYGRPNIKVLAVVAAIVSLLGLIAFLVQIFR